MVVLFYMKDIEFHTLINSVIYRSCVCGKHALWLTGLGFTIFTHEGLSAHAHNNYNNNNYDFTAYMYFDKSDIR